MATAAIPTQAELFKKFQSGAQMSAQDQTRALAGMTPIERSRASIARGTVITGGKVPGMTIGNPVKVPSNATPSSTKPQVAHTPAPVPSGAGSYGAPVSGAYNSTITTTVPMNIGGKVQQVNVADALKLAQGGSKSLPTVIAYLRASGQISKTTNNMTTIANAWSKAVFAGARSQQDPFAYLQNLPTPVSSSKTTPAQVTYVTDYSGSKGQSAFQSAFQNVFARNPIAGDQNSPYKDSKGNPISWITLLNNEAQKPGNAETVSRNKDGSMVVTKGGFDAQAWMTGQLANYYRDGIKSGTLTPENNLISQYQNLANDYGVNIYDPSTKGLTASARLDLSGLETKTKTLDQVKQDWAKATVAQYGNLTPQLIQAGLTLRQVADPALSSMSNILGIDKNSIPLNDQLVQKYLAGDGKTVMPAYQYEQLLRQDPRWAGSKDAQDNLSNVALRMAKDFGVMG